MSNVHEVPFRRWVSDDGSVNGNPSKRKKCSHPSNLPIKKTTSGSALKMLDDPRHNELVLFMRTAQMDDDIIEKVTSYNKITHHETSPTKYLVSSISSHKNSFKA